MLYNSLFFFNYKNNILDDIREMKSVKRVAKTFLISDVDEKIIVGKTICKDVFGYIDEDLGNIEYGIDVGDFSINDIKECTE